MIRTLGAFADPSDQLFAQRVRLDAAGVVDGRLHCSLRIRGGTGEGETAYITLQPGGAPVEEWRRTDLVVFDFEFVQGEPGLGDGAVMLDTDGDGGTLAITLAPSPSTSTIATASPTPSRFRRTSTNRRSIAAPCRLRRR